VRGRSLSVASLALCKAALLSLTFEAPAPEKVSIFNIFSSLFGCSSPILYHALGTLIHLRCFNSSNHASDFLYTLYIILLIEILRLRIIYELCANYKINKQNNNLDNKELNNTIIKYF